jgi:hypothetical protein
MGSTRVKNRQDFNEHLSGTQEVQENKNPFSFLYCAKQ